MLFVYSLLYESSVIGVFDSFSPFDWWIAPFAFAFVFLSDEDFVRIICCFCSLDSPLRICGCRCFYSKSFVLTAYPYRIVPHTYHRTIPRTIVPLTVPIYCTFTNYERILVPVLVTIAFIFFKYFNFNSLKTIFYDVRYRVQYGMGYGTVRVRRKYERFTVVRWGLCVPLRFWILWIRICLCFSNFVFLDF